MKQYYLVVDVIICSCTIQYMYTNVWLCSIIFHLHVDNLHNSLVHIFSILIHKNNCKDIIFNISFDKYLSYYLFNVTYHFSTSICLHGIWNGFGTVNLYCKSDSVRWYKRSHYQSL